MKFNNPSMVSMAMFKNLLRFVLALSFTLPGICYSSYRDGLRAFQQKRFVEAQQLWTIEADKGDPDAQLQLGMMLAVGKYVSRNLSLAETYLQAAADKESVDAMFALAIVHFQAYPDEPTKGLTSLKRAAEKGHKEARSYVELSKTINLFSLGYAPIGLLQDQLLPINFSNAEADSVLGKSVFDRVCMACHVTGAAKAPKIGERGDWKKRQQDNIDKISRRIVGGYKACPPRGGDYTLSDDDVRSAVYYLVRVSR